MTLYESIIVKGDYLIEIYRDNLKISDVNNDYKLVGTITFNINTIRFKDDLINHIIKELVAKSGGN